MTTCRSWPRDFAISKKSVMTWKKSSPRKPIKRRSKFGAIASFSKLAGRRFDSKLERRRGEELVLMEKAGQISDLEFQPQTYLTAALIGYKPDFRYVEDGIEYYEDAKGLETEAFKIKARLWSKYGPGPLRITVKHGLGVKIKKTIHPTIPGLRING